MGKGPNQPGGGNQQLEHSADHDPFTPGSPAWLNEHKDTTGGFKGGPWGVEMLPQPQVTGIPPGGFPQYVTNNEGKKFYGNFGPQPTDQWPQFQGGLRQSSGPVNPPPPAQLINPTMPQPLSMPAGGSFSPMSPNSRQQGLQNFQDPRFGNNGLMGMMNGGNF